MERASPMEQMEHGNAAFHLIVQSVFVNYLFNRKPDELLSVLQQNLRVCITLK